MRTILVVDDQPAVRRLLRALLEMAGFEVSEAEDGAWAMEAIRTRAPDLVVLDIMMPRVDGWQVLTEVRDDPEVGELPVIVLTAKGQPADRLRGWELGCDAYIPKPFDPPECLNEVLAVLNRTPAERRSLRERQLTVVRSMVTGGRRAG
jgi:DNA-binding response OmpR family regulator